MDITYHGISGCVYAEYAGRPALLAPEGCGELTLSVQGFVRMPDGYWYHILTAAEREKLEQAPPDIPLVFEDPDGVCRSEEVRSRKKTAAAELVAVLLLIACFWICYQAAGCVGGVLDACGGCTAQEESDHGASD